MYEIPDDKLERKFNITNYPLNISIEITNHCNLNCIMCHNDKISRAKGYMPMSLYKKIIDETAKEQPSTRIWLDFYGEALLAGWKLYYMIDYAKKTGLTNVCINTNGTLMKPEFAEMLIDAGVDYISLDCDGYSKEVYEKIRVNGDRDVFYSNVEYLLKYREEKKADTIIDIKVIEMEQNRHEVDKIVSYWSSKGAWTAVRRCATWVGVTDDGVTDNNVRIACGHSIGTAAISWDGIVAGCAFDCDLKMSCGNIYEDSIKDIWKRRNDSFVKLQLEHRWDELPEICKKCTDWAIVGEERYDEKGKPINRNYNINKQIFS